MNRMCFTLDQNSKIIIYGAGGLGRKRAKQLIEAGYHVIGFLDKEAGLSKTVFDLPVCSPQSASSVFSVQEDIVIIICVHNALWHQDIALLLNEFGYENILFLPIGERYVPSKCMQLDDGYKHFADQNYREISELPTYSTLTDVNLSVNDAIIEENGEFVTVWMELTFIFTNEKLKKRGNKLTHDFGDVSICALTPYIELFKYCKYGQGNLDLYCKAFKEVQNTIDTYTTDEFVQDRLDLYEVLRTELNKGMSYFVNAAPLLKWNTRCHHFNVIEGHHRLIFLMVEGLRRVPVKISKKDFNIWANERVFFECKEYIQKHKIKKWDAPVPHPGFYHFEYVREKINPTLLMCIQKEFGALDFSRWSFGDLSYSGGYYARAFKSMGCSSVYCFDNIPEHAEMTRLFNKLAFMDDIVIKTGKPITDILQEFHADIVYLSLKSVDKRFIYDNRKEISELASHFLIIEIDNSFLDGDLNDLWPNKKYTLLKNSRSINHQTSVWLLA